MPTLLVAWALAVSGCATTGGTAESRGETQAAQPMQRLRPFMAIYHQGTNWIAGVDVFRQPSIREHVAHHEALRERLVAAGPLRAVQGGVVGIVVILAENQQAATSWLENDPAVRSGVMAAQIGEWRLSAIRPYNRQQ